MTHVLLLLVVELYLHSWPPIGLGDNFEWPYRGTDVNISVKKK